MSPLLKFYAKEKETKEPIDIQICFDDKLGIFRVIRTDETPTRYVASPAIISRKHKRALIRNAANKEKQQTEIPAG